MRRLLVITVALLAVGAAAFWPLTMPRRLPPSDVVASGNAAKGARLFWAGGCASCHAAAGAKSDDRLQLGGGAPLKTAFGTFTAPNISPDRSDGIGAWTPADFANAMQRGIDPQGRHLYPAFPYTSYIKMKPADVADLFAYLKTLPPVAGQAPDNKLAFPFNVRRGIGLWKLLFLGDNNPIIPLPATATPATRAGQYLVEGPGHCGQCHTPRTLGGAGGLNVAQWLAGAPAAEGNGQIPNITPSSKGIAGWSTAEIADYLETGFTPDYDSVGGSMVDVQRNMAMLPADDRLAIASYLKSVPARP